MADTPAPVDRDDPGARGALTVHDRVAEQIAAKAALDTAGVRPYATGLDKITGNTKPKTHVSIAAGRVRAKVDIAVPWSYQLSAIGAAVRANVTFALTHLAGLQVDGVDVAVAAVTTDVASTRKRVQ
ncbi:Asp23/Gls24 family envelope stress response protein [Mycobacterium sp. pW049]|uniref:Asp23/Gls24 family envelope stress response protein n=1 Tax=[Mycobacterium] bulgaricum TaxID=3238985 RepID=UPI00351AE53C